MRFADIYINSKENVAKSLKALWCSDIKNASQAAYAKQISHIIDSIFTSEKSMPLVQCMDPYESILPSQKNEAIDLIGGLWTDEKHLPYKHQYASWKALSEKTLTGKQKSIVVTTGTGSGKTECFMLPLVADLFRKHQNETVRDHRIEAIFLYPLNALMEDQKERLSALLKDTGLTFAVYNGNLPETAEDENGDIIEGLPGEITNRRDMRLTPPNILLTNPTMLEYMLLRQNDQKLFKKESLKWIVLDETHTYTGAAATELAMLLRRVIDAFGCNTDNMHFATSSATIGDVNDDVVRQQENQMKLRTFISSLTGQDIDQIEYIGGKRVNRHSSNLKFEGIRKKMVSCDFLRLDQIVTTPNLSVEERLRILDDWCDNEKYGNDALKAKVHFFFRVPDNGFYVKLSDIENGHFVVYDEIPFEENIKDKTPYLELVRCSTCGEYMALGRCNMIDGTYHHPDKYVEDMFTESENSFSDEKNCVFALTNKTDIDGKENGDTFVSITENIALTEIHRPKGEWVVVRNIRAKCPHCHSSLTVSKEDDEEDVLDELADEKYHSFRLSSDFMGRLVSEPIMNQLNKYGIEHPHNGQQFISFVDSRQAAAKSTLSQNLEEERLWIYSRIFHALCKQRADQKDIIEQRKQLLDNNVPIKIVDQAFPLSKGYTWIELLNILKKDKSTCENLCLQFLNRSKGSNEINDDGTLKNSAVNLYLCSLLFEKLNYHPRIAASPETMALFTTYYPKLDNIELPSEVEEFNKYLKSENQISIEDWKDLLHIFLDFSIRSNGAVEVRLDGDFRDYNTKKCRRFWSEDQKRRPARKPILEPKNGKYSNIVYLLASLYGENGGNESVKMHIQELSKVIDAMWKDLTITTGLLHDLNESKRNLPGYSENYRLNVADIGFKLYDKCCLCDAKKGNGQGMILRPVETTFKGLSPFVIGGKPIKPMTDIEDWSNDKDIYPYYYGSNNSVSIQEIHDWASVHRRILTQNVGEFNNKLWGADGIFASRLDIIYQYPDIFIQAEHTAQIDKIVSKKSQDMFKNYDINILACSTTMEMGVNLGSLEFVMMSSVPPQPSNYKQRAGRSGRNDLTRSACATMCKSDSLGLRTYYDPLGQLINRKIAVPTVDMTSKKVILRHINSYLMRYFVFNYPIKSRHNNLELEVIDFFTRFEFGQKPGPGGRMLPNYNVVNHKDDHTRRINPSDGIGLEGDLEKTYYSKFLSFLDGTAIRDNGTELSLDIESLKRLMDGLTCVTVKEAIDNTRERIMSCYVELKERASQIATKSVAAEETNANQRTKNKWNLEYTGMLANNLIEYMATNRFTPNANMPVDVVSFKQHPEDMHYKKISSDPSYQLAQALTMYTPGNTIVIGNRTRVVRGIKYNEERPKPFKDLYYNGDSVFMGEEPHNALIWDLNNKKALQMIQPTAFLADYNEEEMRLVRKNSHSSVNAMLVNPKPWVTSDSEHLYSIRTSGDKGTSKIVYYNNGIGYGFCVCRMCGRTAVEYRVNKSNRVNPAPYSLNNEKGKDGVPYHKSLSANVKCCDAENQSEYLMRNVILGAEIQTDYCEIKIRQSQNRSWEDTYNEEVRFLLNTLGILFSQKLIEYLDKERGSIEFLITPNMHLCLYDTNSGGCGYSTELSKPEVFEHILHESLAMLKKCNSKDEILDRQHYRYLQSIDIDFARTWLESELNSVAPKIPANIYCHFREATPILFQNLIDRASENTDLCLYVNTDWRNWSYKADDGIDWKSRITPLVSGRFGTKEPKICFLGNLSSVSQYLLVAMNDWGKLYETTFDIPIGIYPVASIGNTLFCSSDSKTISLNSDWAQGILYAIELKPGMISKKQYIPSIDGNLIKLYLDNDDDHILSDKLANLVINKNEKSRKLIQDFAAYAKSINEELEVAYQDDYLRSVISIVTALQFISSFIDIFNKDFSFKILHETYPNRSYRNQQRINFISNIDDVEERDSYMSSIVDDWVRTYYSNDVYCIDYNIDTQSKKSLPHWRMLSFKIGKKQLIIYPNGGIFNGWEFDKENCRKYYSESTNTTDIFPLKRSNIDVPIMYDIELIDL